VKQHKNNNKTFIQI